MAKTTTKNKRKIVHIDEEKCNGCGLCIISCAEGALKIIDGKAKLVSDKYCDGLGACLGECPQGAIKIEEREADEFDEVAVEHHLAEQRKAEANLPCGCPSTTVTDLKEQRKVEANLPCGCPSTTVTDFSKHEAKVAAHGHAARQESTLGHWPVQLRLVPPTAPFLQGADLLLTADCVPFAYPNFHADFLRDHAVLVACPKLDDFEAHQEKLTQIIRQAGLNSITVLHMEVPCCTGLVYMAKEAIKASGKDVPLSDVTIGVQGDRLPSRQR